MRAGRGVTIGDVAKRAGVSVATVSRVVNKRYGVSSDTARRVQAVIDELGYESSLVARSMRSARKHVIGVLTADFEPFAAELLKGAAAAIRHSAYDLIVYASGAESRADPQGMEQRHLSRLGGTLTDGTILVTPMVSELRSPTPVVAVDPKAGATGMPTVLAENREGAIAAVEHLIELGHRRIGFIAGREDLASARLREEGYREALSRAGLAADPDLIERGDYRPDVAVDAVHRLLDPPSRRPTAVFAANDRSAIQVLSRAHDLGLRVPDDLSVVGFDNIPESALSDPSLTTIDQSIQQMGYEAVQLLIRLIESDEDGPPEHIALPTKLVIRDSSGPAPSST